MNENWNEIVDILQSTVGQKHTFDQYKTNIKSCFRILGWKTSNGSMIENYISDTNEIVDLVLYDEYSKRYLPVFINKELTSINSLMIGMDTNIGLLFNDALFLLYRPKNENKIELIIKVDFDASNINGQTICSLLSSLSFNYDELYSYSKNEYEENFNRDKVRAKIANTFNDKALIKQLVRSYLLQKNINAKVLDEELGKYDFTNNQNHKQEKNEKTENHRDTTQFSIDGEHFYHKRVFPLKVIQQYVLDHPTCTYKDLEEQFPSKIISKERGVIRPLKVINEWMKDNPDVRSRYCLKNDEIITLADGEQLAVHNQWGTKHFPAFLEVAKALYNVTSTNPYKYELQENNSTDSKTIKISDDSLKSFRLK